MRGAGKAAGIIALAIMLSLGLAVSGGYAAKAKKVASEVEVEGWYFDDDDGDMIAVGDVYANKPKCERKRTVTVIRNDGPLDPPPDGEGEPVAEVITDATGDWQLNLETDGDDTPNHITAKVARKKVKTRSGKNLLCKADVAPAIQSD